jgi:hypothetical protein
MLTALMTVLAQKLAIGQVQTMTASNFHQLAEPVRPPQHQKLHQITRLSAGKPPPANISACSIWGPSPPLFATVCRWQDQLYDDRGHPAERPTAFETRLIVRTLRRSGSLNSLMFRQRCVRCHDTPEGRKRSQPRRLQLRTVNISFDRASSELDTSLHREDWQQSGELV